MTTGLLTVSAYVTNPPVQLSTDDVLEVRGWYTRPFIAGDGSTPVEGNFTNGQFGPYYSITPTLNGSGNLVVPAHEIQATTLSNPTGNYIEQLWVNGALVMVLMPNTQGATGWQIPTVYGDPIAFDEIATYNRAKRLLYPPDTYFTADETIEEIRRLSGDRAYASSTIVGITALSKDPDVPSFPEARGTNDPQWAQASVDDPSAAGDGFFDPDEGEFFGSSLANVPSQFLRANSAINAANVEGLVFNLATYGGVCDGVTADDTALARALAEIGSTQAILVLPYTVEGQCLLELDATIPANVTIDFDASGTGFKLTNSRTLTIVGPMISVPHQVFFHATSGQGTISFAGNHKVSSLWSEYWGAVADNSTDCYAAIQAAQTALSTITGGTLSYNEGTYCVSSAALITSGYGITWQGAGRYHTIIKSTGADSAVRTLGFQYSNVKGIQFTTVNALANLAPFALDGDASHVVQGNTFADCLFVGNGSSYNFTGGISGQAWQGSENLFLNTHFQGGTLAAYYQTGSNALGNTFVGGDLQHFDTHGIQIVGGSVGIYGTNFESNNGYTQIINGGFDIDASTTGVYEAIVVSGCRSESLRFYNGSVSQVGVIKGFSYEPAAQYTWVALTHVDLNTVIFKTAPNSTVNMYRVTTAGTSGAGEPTWPNSGTVADGSAIWTLTALTVVNLPTGSIQDSTGFIGQALAAGGLPANFVALGHSTVTVPLAGNATVGVTNNLVFVSAATGARAITIGSAAQRPPDGQILTIKKTDTSVNAVTLTFPWGNGIYNNGAGGSTLVIPGGSDGYVTLRFVTDGNAIATPSDNWIVVSKSFAMDSAGSALSISSNTIAPTSTVHQCGAGLIKTITVPSGFVSGNTITLLPTAAFTYDNSDNIAVATGTAVVGRAMTFTLLVATWYPSY